MSKRGTARLKSVGDLSAQTTLVHDAVGSLVLNRDFLPGTEAET